MDSMNLTKESEIGPSQTYAFASAQMAVVSGFQEMPGWSIVPVGLELIRKGSSDAIGWRIMSCSQNGGLNPVGDTLPISYYSEHTS